MTATIVRAAPEHLSEVAVLFDVYRRFYGKESDLESATTFIAARLEQEDSALFLALNRTTAVGVHTALPQLFIRCYASDLDIERSVRDGIG